MNNIELFAGAGGMALGLEKAGFHTLALNEFNHDACETLRKNRPDWNIIEGDIKSLTDKNLLELFSLEEGELDLLSGGAPCQAFSYAGKRLGLEDTRGTLFYHYAIFLKQLKPKMFIFENVKGLLTHDKGKTYATILNVFMNEGYKIYKGVLNAWDYDVAQRRERLITVGIRNDLAKKISFQFPKPQDYKPVLMDILPNCPKGEGMHYSKEKEKIFALVPQGGWWKDIDPNIAKQYMKSCWDNGGGRTGILRRLSMEEPSLTITTSPAQKTTDRCHPLETRPLTIRESARCQSFPDDWEFVGSISSQYKQIGNAVPVNLAYYLGLELMKSLKTL